MPCKFCQKETDYVPLVIKGGNGDNSFHTFEVYYCYGCAAEFVEWRAAPATHLYTTINNRMYRWSIGTESCHIWYVGKPGEPGVRPNKDLKLVKTFKSDFPQITPENIERKLRFILLFL